MTSLLAQGSQCFMQQGNGADMRKEHLLQPQYLQTPGVSCGPTGLVVDRTDLTPLAQTSDINATV